MSLKVKRIFFTILIIIVSLYGCSINVVDKASDEGKIELYDGTVINERDVLALEVRPSDMTLIFRDNSYLNLKFKSSKDDEYIDTYNKLAEGIAGGWVYHGFKEVEIPLGDGSAILPENVDYPHLDIIYFNADGDNVVHTKYGYLEIYNDKSHKKYFLPYNN